MSHMDTLIEYLDEHWSQGLTLDEEMLDTCLADIKDVIMKSAKGRKPSLSPSQNKLTTKEIWLILNDRGDEVERPTGGQFALIALAGSVLEPILVMLMKHAGVPFKRISERVKIPIEGTDIVLSGEFDYTIVNEDGVEELWDMKTSNPYNFQKSKYYDGKFTSPEALVKGDKYGYLGQGAAYAKGAGVPFAGWHALDRAFFKTADISAESLQYEMDQAWESFEERIRIASTAKTLEELDD